MALLIADINNFVRMSAQANNYAPSFWAFSATHFDGSTEDTLAEILVAGYFNLMIESLTVGDIIYCYINGQIVPVKVTSVTTNVTVEVDGAVTVMASMSGAQGIGAVDLGVDIPEDAIIIDSFYDVGANFTSAGDNATIALSIEGPNDCVSALAIDDASNIWDAGKHGTLVGNFALDGNALTAIQMAAARSGSYIKTTAKRAMTATIAVEALTASSLRWFVTYVQGLPV
jgi:hypothetical protein